MSIALNAPQVLSLVRRHEELTEFLNNGVKTEKELAPAYAELVGIHTTLSLFFHPNGVPKMTKQEATPFIFFKVTLGTVVRLSDSTEQTVTSLYRTGEKYYFNNCMCSHDVNGVASKPYLPSVVGIVSQPLKG